MKNILFIAPPAAGKGTISEMLIAKYGYTHISTGEILRAMAKKNDDLGLKINELLTKGELVPNDIIYEALEKRLMENDTLNGYILDGFPRNIEQAIKYDEILSKLKKSLGVVIELKTPKNILEKRITGRRICSNCNKTYNVLTGVNTPIKDGICDDCGNSLYQRSDDNQESFKLRYKLFEEKTYPLIKYYQNRGNYYEIDSINPDETLKEIEGIIND